MPVKRIYFLFAYISFWLFFFIVSKTLFLLYNLKVTSSLDVQTILGIFLNGLKLDFSAIGYLLIIPVFVIVINFFFKSNYEYHILKIYTIIVLVLNVFFVVTDVELYKHWGFRLDKTPLNYIDNPKDMLASIPWPVLFLGLLSTGILSVCFVLIYNRYVAIHLKQKITRPVSVFLFYLLAFPALIIPIRGGFDTSPANHSSVYFSTNTFANHAALNILWNIGNSLSKKEQSNKYQFFTSEVANKNISELIDKKKSQSRFLSTSKPNILLIILESFTAKAIEPLGGMKDVTPGFNKLADSGILFTNFYSIAERSDKGICAIISGYPAFGTTSVLKYPEKFEKLESISETLVQTGYKTAFYYGGDIDFFNFKAYFLDKRFQKLVSKDDFNAKLNVSKWGVPDEFVFEKLYNDLTINNIDIPFFNVLFTLSSHEPFDIPSKSYLEGSSETVKFINSLHYTDSCLYSFIERFRGSELWESTLVIIMADHGAIFINDLPYYDTNNYHIPFLWTGGAVIKDTIITKYGYQLDFPNTLLNQLGLSDESFIYGKDLFNKENEGFAYYIFNDGFGFINDSTNFIFDNRSGSVLKTDNLDSRFIDLGKSLLQVSYKDFLSK